MSGCTCDSPQRYRATGENVGKDELYLRCLHCGGKAGRITVDIDELTDTLTNPEDIPDVDKRTTIQFVPGDNPWMHE
jgi:hypothetical protein